MDIDKLRKLYTSNRGVRLLCDHMASRKKNQAETKVRVITSQLDLSREEVVEAFKELESVEVGRYLRGYQPRSEARFAWGAVPSRDIVAAARGERAVVDERDDDAQEDDIRDMVEHVFQLRLDLSVTFELPTDLTSSEASRLSRFVSALSFAEDE